MYATLSDSAELSCAISTSSARLLHRVATKHLQLWLDVGIRHFRLEFAHESAQHVHQVVAAFQHALAGERSFESLERELKRLAPQGITEGSLFVPLDYSRMPQLL
jgi:putative protease